MFTHYCHKQPEKQRKLAYNIKSCLNALTWTELFKMFGHWHQTLAALVLLPISIIWWWEYWWGSALWAWGQCVSRLYIINETAAFLILQYSKSSLRQSVYVLTWYVSSSEKLTNINMFVTFNGGLVYATKAKPTCSRVWVLKLMASNFTC